MVEGTTGTVGGEGATERGFLTTLRGKARWTLATLGFLVVAVLGTIYSLASIGVDPLLDTIGILIALVLMWLMWTEVRRNVLIVLAVGAISAVSQTIMVVVAPNPAYGPIEGQAAYAVFLYLLPLFAYLAYRELDEA